MTGKNVSAGFLNFTCTLHTRVYGMHTTVATYVAAMCICHMYAFIAPHICIYPLHYSDDRRHPLAIKCFSNRSACYKQLSNFDGVIEDTSAVLDVEPNNVKALMRRAQAFEAIERYVCGETINASSAGCALAPQHCIVFFSWLRERLN